MRNMQSVGSLSSRTGLMTWEGVPSTSKLSKMGYRKKSHTNIYLLVKNKQIVLQTKSIQVFCTDSVVTVPGTFHSPNLSQHLPVL